MFNSPSIFSLEGKVTSFDVSISLVVDSSVFILQDESALAVLVVGTPSKLSIN